MKQLFNDDAYLKESNTKVIDVMSKNTIVVEDNVFYPQGGGQKGDIGNIIIDGKTYNVINTVKNKNPNDSSYLIVDEDISDELKGKDAILKLNWDFRYRQMKLHTSLHLYHCILESVLDLKLPNPVSSVIKENSHAFLIYEEECINKEVVDKATEIFLNEIKIDNEVSTYPDAELEGYRWWKYKEWLIPCGGTHIKKVNEIGDVYIEYSEKSGRKTIHIYLGKREVEEKYMKNENKEKKVYMGASAEVSVGIEIKIQKVKSKTEEIVEQLKAVTSLAELNDIRVQFLGKKGTIAEYAEHLSSYDPESKKQLGLELNIAKNRVAENIELKKAELENIELSKKLETESIDITLPATNISVGAPSILEKVIEELEEFLMSMGYDVVEGPELEQDLYNFELLNLPKGHPARDAQDTFYVEDDVLLLRTHTSPGQIRTMLANTEKTPIRIVCPGKTYRRDEDDATHSHQFAQIEGLLVDKNVSMANLKATFDAIAKHLFGQTRETRFRPSYYPFTEPSVEMDISCFICNGEGCSLCKGTGWITVGGAGMVHYNVLNNCGYDPQVWSGFAFGFGIERLAMLKYGITDIRTFYTNDLRNKDSYNRIEV